MKQVNSSFRHKVLIINIRFSIAPNAYVKQQYTQKKTPLESGDQQKIGAIAKIDENVI